MYPETRAMDDPYLPYQWHMTQIQVTNIGTSYWGAGTTVAVIDTGVSAYNDGYGAALGTGYDFYNDDYKTYKH